MKRILKWMLMLILLMGIIFVIVSACAEGRKLVMRLKPMEEELTRPRRGEAYISGITEYGSTCVSYTYTVHNGTDTGVEKYEYFMTILDDPRPNAYADTLYDSGVTTENELSFTFYQTGKYVLFVYRYDRNGEIVKHTTNDGKTYDYVQCYIRIEDDKP